MEFKLKQNTVYSVNDDEERRLLTEQTFIIHTSSGFLIKDDRLRLVESLLQVLRNCANAAVRFNSTTSRIESRTPLQYVKYDSQNSSS